MKSDAYSQWKGWTEEVPFGRLDRGDTRFFRSELRHTLPLPAGALVLDVGYGDGDFLAFARGEGWVPTGVELSPYLVERAKVAGYEAMPHHGLASLPDRRFDLIVALDVLEHIPPDETVEFLSELRRKLAPAGAILLRYPNADSTLGNPYQYGDPTHVNAIGWFKLTYYCSRTGLRIIGYEPTSRRGFSSSISEGIHRLTAGAYAALAGAVRRWIYFRGLPIVLSNGSVTSTLQSDDDQ